MVWWSRGKSLAFPGSRVRPSLARCARSFSRARCALSFSRPAAVVQAVCPGLALGASWPALWARLGSSQGRLRGLLGASWAPNSRPRAPKSGQVPPKSGQERPKSGQERPKSAQEAPSSPKRLRRLIFGRFGSPFRLDFGRPGASKISKKCRTVVKNQGFRGLARGARKRPEKAPKEAPRRPPPGPKPEVYFRAPARSPSALPLIHRIAIPKQLQSG